MYLVADHTIPINLNCDDLMMMTMTMMMMMMIRRIMKEKFVSLKKKKLSNGGICLDYTSSVLMPHSLFKALFLLLQTLKTQRREEHSKGGGVFFSFLFFLQDAENY